MDVRGPAVQRRSVEVDGLGHGSVPIPAASRIANVVYTGGISGIDRTSHALPDEPGAQCANMFANLDAVLRAAGAQPADVIKLTLYVRSRDIRSAIDAQWTRMFPHAESRPARHVLVYAELPPGMLVQCEAVAVIT